MEPQNTITPSNENLTSPNVKPDLMQQPAAQIITPPNYSQTTVSAAANDVPNTSAQETTILYDTGYLQNVFQKSMAAKRLTLTLYISHLKVEDADTGEVLEDTPINQILKTTRYFSSRLLYLLYVSLFGSRFLLIKTTDRRYKISWVNSDKQSVITGGGALGNMVAQENFAKTMQWVKAIKDLQASPQSSYSSQPTNQVMPIVGVGQTRPVVSSQPTSYQNTTMPKQHGRRWPKILSGVVTAFLIFCVLFVVVQNIATKNTVKVSDQFVADIQADNENAAWALTSPAFQKTTSQASFTQAISAISPGLQGTATISSNGKNLVPGGQAMIVYTISGSSGDKYMKIALKNNKPWQVNAYTTSAMPLNAHTQLDGYY